MGNFLQWSTRSRTDGFLKSTWNFLEASHGEGAADGIGAAIKRAADQQVIVKKKDVTDAKVFVDMLASGDSKIKLFKVNEESISEMEAKLPNTLQAIPNTMKLHQANDSASRDLVVSGRDSEIKSLSSESVTAANEIATSEILATASDTLVHSNHTEVDRRETNGLVPVDCVEDSLIGKYCEVVYDNMPYPGIIMDVDDSEEMEVKVMCRIGPNRFFWPLVEDRLWYSKKCVITLINEEPELVTKRHRKIPSHLWSLIVQKLDLDEQGRPSK